MDLEQIRRTLEEKFSEYPPMGSSRQIIFWYDAKGDFAEEVGKLELSNGKLWHLKPDNNFLTKYTIEELDPESNYVIYSRQPKPVDAENWLLDTLLYSYEFTADRITMVMNDLKVPQSLRGVFTRYERFFANKERRTRFANFNITDYTEPVIDRAILSALTKQQAVSVSDALRALFCESLDEENNALWQSIEKFGDPSAFWSIMEREYGFRAEQKNLEALFISLVITAFAEQFTGYLPKTWQRYVLDQRANCVVFIDHFINHMVQGKVFRELVQELEHTLHFSDYIEEWDLPDYAGADIFPSLDKAVIVSLVTSIERGVDNYEYYLDTISQRENKHFYSEYSDLYDVLKWAIHLLGYQKEFNRGFLEHKAELLFQAYSERYYEVDYAYRKYCLAYEQEKGREFLHPLNERIENLYCNWFLADLSIKWSESVEKELARSWMLKKVRSQQSFYASFVEPVVHKNERVFVIVSDALRWEVGYELMESLNQKVRGLSSIEPMLGVIPSYTQLGMASLLPHRRLQITDGTILADGLSTSGMENRQKILQQNAEAIALKLPDLLNMDRQTVRETVKGKNAVYIYHDVIDAIGDQAKTEEQTFSAAEKAIQEIVDAVEVLVKNLTEVNVYITSDHGFIYQRSPLQESDKTLRGEDKPILSNRRYMLFDGSVEVPNTLSINLNYLFGMENKFTAVVPRANNRYKLQGSGERYVHGGASLQEIVIPLVHFEKDRKKDVTKEVTKVNILLLDDVKRVTNSIFTLRFFQAEPVGGKVTPRQVKAYFVDPAGNVISDEVMLVANSTEERVEERIYRLRFTLKSQQYDRSATYRLVLEDLEETVETIHAEIPFTLDLGIMHDFDL